MTKLEIPNYQRTHNDTSLVIRISGFRRHGVFRHSSIAWGLFIIRHSAVFSVLLFAGGVCYTVGVLFYVAKKVQFTHAIWHMFVVAGCVCHFCAIYYHVI